MKIVTNYDCDINKKESNIPPVIISYKIHGKAAELNSMELTVNMSVEYSNIIFFSLMNQFISRLKLC